MSFRHLNQLLLRNIRTEKIVAFLNELNDDEFDDAVHQVISEAEALLAERFDTELVDPVAKTIANKRMMEVHVEPLVREIEPVARRLG
jgi:hypothetical protein